jgi:Tol biopolymer transport system component
VDSGGEALVYRTPADGGGDADPLHRGAPGVIQTQLADVSPDGEYLALNIAAYAAAAPLADPDPEKRTEIDMLRAEFDVGALRFSPDMRFIAYTYDESGRPEVYLAPFDAETGEADQGRSHQVSREGAAGGLAWRADGQELYYLGERLDTPELNDFSVMAVDVTTEPALTTSEPHALFEIDLPPEVTAGANVVGNTGSELFWRIASPDGRRFLLVQPAKPGHDGGKGP